MSKKIEEITGTVTGVKFRGESGWTVFTLAPLQTSMFYSAITAVGEMHPEPLEDEELTLTGSWQQHDKWGNQFVIDTLVDRKSPRSRNGLIAYLASGLFPGVGEVIAARIVDEYGEDTHDVLLRFPQRLAELKGITEEMAQDIAKVWNEEKDARSAIIYLCDLGLTTKMAGRIWETYRLNTVAKVQQNPYRLAWDVDGIGFKRADEIARAVLNCGRDDTRRVGAGLLHALKAARKNGHTYLPEDDLLDNAADLLGVDDQALIQSVLSRMLVNEASHSSAADTIVEDIGVGPAPVYYLPALWTAEKKSSERIARIVGRTVPDIETSDALDRLILEAEANMNMMLTDTQVAAIKMALTSKISVITGGPGTGKSTILRAVTDILSKLEYSIMLCAPTGRAAKRMFETTGWSASTIHRALEYKVGPAGARFNRNESNPLDASYHVIDEASMVDIALMKSFLVAVQDHQRVLLVGDIDQLPSVGPGNVLRDIIGSETVPVVRLDTIFRQSEKSKIVTNAHAINHGAMPDTSNDSDDFFFFKEEAAEDIANRILDIVGRRLPDKRDFDPIRDIQVLSPMYRGASGVNMLNKRLQHMLNPPSPDKVEYKTGLRTYRVGDRVMQLKNNYDLDVFNGDTGFITSIDLTGRYMDLDIEGRRISYDFKFLRQLALAYACTIHKSQGGEYPAVVMPVTTANYIMLQRNLLYTGVTRGKQTVVLVGSLQAIGIAVGNAPAIDRNSALTTRLRHLIGRPEYSII